MSASQETAETAVDNTMTMAGVGRLLLEAREQAGLTREEVAAQLRLSVRQIAALETGNMEALPGTTFVRGFIRNYAKLLQIDAQPLLDALSDFAPATHIRLGTENILIEDSKQSHGRTYLLIGMLLLLLLVAAIWFQEQRNEPEAPVPAAAPSPPAGSEIPLQLQPLPLESMPAIPAELASEVSPAADAPAAQPAARQLAHLQLSSTQASWVNVHDGDGKELFNATIPAGGSHVLEGIPPLKVVLGNATGMQVIYNNEPVDFTMHTYGNVARFTLE